MHASDDRETGGMLRGSLERVTEWSITTQNQASNVHKWLKMIFTEEVAHACEQLKVKTNATQVRGKSIRMVWHST